MPCANPRERDATPCANPRGRDDSPVVYRRPPGYVRAEDHEAASDDAPEDDFESGRWLEVYRFVKQLVAIQMGIVEKKLECSLRKHRQEALDAAEAQCAMQRAVQDALDTLSAEVAAQRAARESMTESPFAERIEPVDHRLAALTADVARLAEHVESLMGAQGDQTSTRGLREITDARVEDTRSWSSSRSAGQVLSLQDFNDTVKECGPGPHTFPNVASQRERRRRYQAAQYLEVVDVVVSIVKESVSELQLTEDFGR